MNMEICDGHMFQQNITRFGISKRKRERNVEIFISHKSLFSSHSQVLLAVASG
jgi:hypothetical protein